MSECPPAPAPAPAAGEAAEDRYHYRVIARALRMMEAGGPPLTLEALAARMGMSAAHFQRLFSAWVGVSPKRYQQYLALDLARQLLSDRETLLEAAAGAGLSGTGRLHDLFLRWEAMTPGDFARGGDGVQIRWGRFDTPFGAALAMGTERGLCGLAFTEETGFDAAFADLASRWPAAHFTRDGAPLSAWIRAAFGKGGGGGAGGEARLQIIGAPFQIKVWEALLRIPSGHVTTYSAVASAIGAPGAARAVGTAIGRNPIGFLIPCHRALARSGALGGYHWGLPVKRAMLAWEAARWEAASPASPACDGRKPAAGQGGPVRRG
ncbi:MAG: methylated-DNA--[protein]-cysteine S-methyltransferase [Defluviimonas sp.]|nr:methylated-DNA--[protein]-cysteine S-methyltransferase [Defluviimonas sp.]